jgi:hypothetical protein
MKVSITVLATKTGIAVRFRVLGAELLVAVVMHSGNSAILSQRRRRVTIYGSVVR